MNRQVARSARSARKLLGKIVCFALIIVAASSVSIAQENPPWPPDPETLFAPGFEVVSVEYFELPEPTPIPTADFFCDQPREHYVRRSDWVYYPRGKELFLCGVGSGELLGPINLTLDDVGYHPEGYNAAALTPDKTWLVYARDVFDDEKSAYRRHIFSYRLEDGLTNALGVVDVPTGINDPWLNDFGKWMSATRGTIEFMLLGDSVADLYYTFDVTEPDSIEEIDQGFLTYYDNPPRYQYISTAAFLWIRTALTAHFDCFFLIYDAAGANWTNLGYDCIGARVPRGDEDYFTVQVDDAESATSNFIRFDPHTGEKTVLLSGEIEWLSDLSPDGRYAVLVLGDNGRIDLIDYFDYMFQDLDMLPMPQTVSLVIWDTEANTTVYEAVLGSSTDRTSVITTQQWCGNDCLLYTYDCNEFTLVRLNAEPQFVSPHLSLGCGGEISFEKVVQFSPDQRYIYYNYYPKMHQLTEIATGTTQPLFRPENADLYNATAAWIDNDMLEVRLLPPGNSQDRRVAVYTVRITPETAIDHEQGLV